MSKLRLLVVLTGSLALGVGSLLAGGATANAATNPPGNNGTVKVDKKLVDEATPDNVPHVGCQFRVDFAGYDEGDYTADVEFALQSPTGDEVVLADQVFVGRDAAGGATDFDASKTYELSPVLLAYDAHPQQGYHIKLTVSAPASLGATTKYKTFWVDGCTVTPPPPPDPT